jgi:fucose permease
MISKKSGRLTPEPVYRAVNTAAPARRRAPAHRAGTILEKRRSAFIGYYSPYSAICQKQGSAPDCVSGFALRRFTTWFPDKKHPRTYPLSDPADFTGIGRLPNISDRDTLPSMTDQRRPFSRRALLFVIYGNMILYGFVQSMRGVIYPLMKNDFAVSYSQQGFLMGLLSFVSVTACAVAGVFLNHFGFRKAIALGFVAVMGGMGAFGLIPFAGFGLVSVMFIVIQWGLGFFEIGLNGLGSKTFTRKSALMMSLLHFFYGVGAILGPAFAGIVVNSPRLNWRFVYPIGLIPMLIMALVSFFAAPGEKAAEKTEPGIKKTEPERRYGFWSAMKDPMVWRFGFIMGLTSAGESGTSNWSGLYLHDVYGYDPRTTIAFFLSSFYVLYTLSRLFGGFIIEKAGYIKSLCAASAAVIILFALGFILGRNGIWVLPFTGLFLAILWPTILAVGIGIFGKRAQTANSAIIVIAFSLGGIIQFLIGLVNRFAGEAWGYRSCLIYLIAMGICLWRLARLLRVRRAAGLSPETASPADLL